MGRPAHQPTDKQREACRRYAASGVAQHRIAAALGISEPTLRDHYRAELDECVGLFEAKLEQALCNRALEHDCPPAILIFTAKVRLKYREMVAEDPDVKKPADMTDDELRDAIAARERERRSGQRGSAPSKRANVAA